MASKFDLLDLMDAKDFIATKKLIETNQKIIEQGIPAAGGNWLHYAAKYSSVEIVEHLLKLGFDLNEEGTLDGDRPIDRAAAGNQPDIVAFLLEKGAILDTDKSVRNPLFGAIIGKSTESARLLLEAGIDASVRYNSDTMDNMDALAFSLLHGQTEIANMIALHIADNAPNKARILLEEAAKIANYNGPLVPIRILTSDEDMLDD